VLALGVLDEDLEVGEHGGQRRAQLVRGVGDELALAGQRGLGLGARFAERREHRLQRLGQLGDLVLGVRARDPHRRVARALDLARGGRQLRDRLYRPARGRQARQQREQAAAEHAEGEEHLHAVRRRLHGGQPLRVLDDERLRVADQLDGPRLHAPAVDVRAPPDEGAEVRRARAAHHVAPVERDDPHGGVLAADVVVEARAADLARDGRAVVALDEPQLDLV
jgi:hypothetical protein